jgi:hypothetical protein
MPSLPPWSVLLGRSLAAHLDQLRSTIDALGGRLRDAVAQAVGQSVAGTVREAVRALLGTGPPEPESPYATARTTEPSAWWRDEQDRRWPVSRASPWSDPYDDEDEPDRFDSSTPPDDGKPARWCRALAAGLEAAAWWLRRQVGKPSLLAALAVGLIFAGLAWLVGPHFAGSALALAALAGLIRLASLALTRTNHT